MQMPNAFQSRFNIHHVPVMRWVPIPDVQFQNGTHKALLFDIRISRTDLLEKIRPRLSGTDGFQFMISFGLLRGISQRIYYKSKFSIAIRHLNLGLGPLAPTVNAAQTELTFLNLDNGEFVMKYGYPNAKIGDILDFEI